MKSPEVMALILRHLFEFGCSACKAPVTPATLDRFQSFVTTDKQGVILSVSHKCRRCLAEAN